MVSVSDIVTSTETLEPEKELRIAERAASSQGGGIEARFTTFTLNSWNSEQSKGYSGLQATAYFLKSF